jgi:hypothetical protein
MKVLLFLENICNYLADKEKEEVQQAARSL